MRRAILTLAAMTLVAGTARPQTLADTVGGCLGNPPENTIDADPSNYRNLLTSLGPGDRLLLAAGTYTQGLPVAGLNGEPGRCIVIEGPATGAPAIIRPPSSLCCNTVSLRGSSYVALRHLEIDSQDVDGIDGIKAESDTPFTHHVNLEDLYLHGQGGGQQTVGISTKSPAWNWVIRRCRIEGAGTGLYLGDSDGSAEFVGGLVEHNLVRDTIGYNMQVKHQNGPRDTGIGVPASATTVIRHNVFSKAQNGSSGPDARPNLLVGHFPATGAGSTDVYEIYGNFFHQNPDEGLFQGTGNVALYDNVFLNDFGLAVNFQFHEGGGNRDVEVFHNTVVGSGTGINLTGLDSGSYTRRVRANAVFAATPLNLASGVVESDNVTDTYADADSYLLDPLSPVGAGLDLFPEIAQLTGAPVSPVGFDAFLDWDRDFNGTARDLAFRGAYSGEGANPGWALDLDLKPEPATPPPLALSIDDVTVGESGGAAVLTVTLSAGTSDPVTVSYATADGTASAGSDYDSTSGTLSFPPAAGPQTQTLAVTVTDDGLDEDDETVLVNLSGPSGAAVSDGMGWIVVTDDDPSPVVSIGDAPALLEGDSGVQQAVFAVTLSEASGRVVTVDYATAPGTANGDFGPASGTLSFAAGETLATLAVAVLGDPVDEDDESFSVVLSNPQGAVLGDPSGSATILDDDASPGMVVRGTTVREGQTGTRDAVFQVTLSLPSGRVVTVDWATASGTAGSTDFVPSSGTLTFPPGARSRQVHVAVNGDTAPEPDETFFVSLTGAAGANVTIGQAVGRILDDDRRGPRLRNRR